MDTKTWWLLTPDPSARVLTIDSLNDLKAAIRRFLRVRDFGPFHDEGLDFEAMQREYDALHLTERGQWATRLTQPDLYGWDCESTAWFRWCFTDVQAITPVIVEK